MQALFGITRSPEDPRWVLIVLIAGLAAAWYNHWTGRWWWWRSRGRTIFSCVVLVGLIAAYYLVD
ncbi:hypothetical protein [Caulobacter sp. 17J65-9]|uniref:hypothetical protein n=1 Tax=Caulobacter sp. 17J65-9 TaxID=2709382 RepID=UPI0013C85C3A|nr:hypothetical protein [Caulobacter sp. 17J65-9]NEX94089.1 hypothetical protein [Caulobacter sp. 17J65-9]